MNRNKRRQEDNSFTDYNNNNIKKPRQNKITLSDRITNLEDLSNELFYEIFEYLIDHHAFQAFYDLNYRFQKLVLNSNSTIKINISSISKSQFHHYLTDRIKPCTSRIELFRLSNPCIDPCSLLLPIITKLTQLTTLILNNIEANFIEPIVNQLSSLPVLSSLTIVSISNIITKNNLYSKLFQLPKLKYCQIDIELLDIPKKFTIATNEFSTIEWLIINHRISIDKLLILLTYVPQLRRLSIDQLVQSEFDQLSKTSTNLNYLTNVSLKFAFHFNVPFQQFEILVENYFHQVQVLNIKTQSVHLDLDTGKYLNANRWEQLISTSMLNLRIFNFQQSYRGFRSNEERQAFDYFINKFNSKFWIEHQWFFDYHYHETKRSTTAVFYSRNPYRKKDYVLYDELIDNIYLTCHDINEDPIHHICLHTTDIIKQCYDKFPNATELTFCEDFEVPRVDSIVVDLNRFLPLKQLTKLSIKCHRFTFEQLIELLQFTPNIHTLELDSIVLFRTDPILIQNHELTQLVSKINLITNVTIMKEITVEKIQLLTVAFPRIEHLTINLFKEDLRPIVKYLFSKLNNNTRYLSLLHISKQRHDWMILLKSIIKSKKLPRNYVFKVINRTLYIWW
ncbi:unnamed protein product [Adineta steineri]|uniref:F-box domain-containing protein n=1 Tax=Adineta steineri TaxID=433720 RepID=A0A814G7I8_9BILA|nr:unnamed protein product [Adineta steineri]